MDKNDYRQLFSFQEIHREKRNFYNEELLLEISSNRHFSKDSFLKYLSSRLGFPKYFGNNWDALEDSLRDFSWTDKKKITIKHKGIPNMDKIDLKIYLEILINCVKDWQARGGKKFVVIFPPDSKEKLDDLLACPSPKKG